MSYVLHFFPLSDRGSYYCGLQFPKTKPFMNLRKYLSFRECNFIFGQSSLDS